MWAYVVRRVLYNVPVYLSIILLMMLALRVRDPVYAYLGKSASEEQIQLLREGMGLDQPFIVQYGQLLWDIVRLDFSQSSWKYQGTSVREIILRAVPPSLSITVPALVLATGVSICIGLISSYHRGRWLDRGLVVAAVLGMSVSFLVYIIFGQFFGAFYPQYAGWTFRPFAITGYESWLDVTTPTGALSTWARYCLLPVLISVIVALGYDTRFYRSVMVEESGRDYITTAFAKGATVRRVMFVHMLKNAMIPIITRVMTTLPFLITGSVLLEMYFSIPGMGRTLITALYDKDFPVIQAFVSLFAAFFIATIILTDVLYALVDPRVRLS